MALRIIEGFLALRPPVIEDRSLATLDAEARLGRTLPNSYLRFLERVQPCDICHHFTLSRPELLMPFSTLEERASEALGRAIVFARGFEGQRWAFLGDEPEPSTVLIPAGALRLGDDAYDDARRCAPNFDAFIEYFRSGRYSRSCNRAFIVPFRAEWERHRITALSGQDDFRLTRDRLVAALISRHDAVLLLSVEGTRNAQHHLFLPASEVWLVVTVVDASTTQASFDVDLDVRLPPDFEGAPIEALRDTLETDLGMALG